MVLKRLFGGIRFALLCTFLIVTAFQAAAVADSSVIRRVVVKGAERIEPGTIRSYLLLREGDTFEPARIDRSLKSLFATGLFADVSMNREGDDLLVQVVENPIINRIAFEGNVAFEDDTLNSEVSLRPRVVYTRTKVQNDVARILTLYRQSGYFAANVDPKIIQLPQNRVDLIYEIKEGKPTGVRRIRFVGNSDFSDADLREQIRTKESSWYRFLSSDDNYDPDRLNLDRQLLRRFYLKNGYADFRVLSAVAEITPDREAFFITFTVEEGGRYKIGDVKIEPRLRDLTVEQVENVVELKTGDWYSNVAIEEGVHDLTNAVSELGYTFIDVRQGLKRDRKNKIIDITYRINEGARVFVERIDISGNTRTAGEVIRREFKMVEGDAFNAAKLRRSRRNIQNLDFFKAVEIEKAPGSGPDQTVVRVAVKEKPTGSLNLGFGFSSAVGVLGVLGIEERNLLGQGYRLKLNGQFAERAENVDISFTDPYFLDRDVAAGFDVFVKRRDWQDSSSYDEENKGVAFRIGYPITDDLRQNWKYTIRKQKITDVDDDASQYVKAEEGENIISEVSQSLNLDKTDSRVNPTKGYFASWGIDIAGLGGDQNYVRNNLSFGHYTPVAPQWVWSNKVKGGYIVGIGDDVGMLERYRLGGGASVRGFANGGIGPRDISTDDSLGGEWRYSMQSELKFPLGLPDYFGLRGKVFIDAGSLGKLRETGANIEDTGSIRVSSGVGVSWDSPLGPTIGLDVGFPIVKEDFDETEMVHVNFGTRF